MDFDMNLRRDDRCTLVRVQGEIDVMSRERFEETLLTVVEGGGPMVVDMHEVTFCDSTGLNALVVAQRRALERDTPVSLAGLAPRVLRVFTITGLDKLIPIYDTLDEALGALPSSSPN